MSIFTTTIRRSAVFALVSACGVFSVGCATEPESQTPGDAVQPRPGAPVVTNIVEHDAYAALGYRLQWRGFAQVARGFRVSDFAIVGDALVVQSDEGVVSVIDTGSGELRWADRVAGALTKFVGLNRMGDQLVVSTESEAFFYDLRTSNLDDKQRFSRVVNTTPAQVGALLIYGTTGGELISHLSTNGFQLWANSVRGSITADPVLLSDDIVGVVSQSGDVLFVNGQTGLSTGRNRIWAGPGAALDHSEDLLFVASLDQSIYAFEARGGEQRWRRRTNVPLTDAPVHHAGRVYCVVPDEGLLCLDADTGREQWVSTSITRGHAVGMRSGRLIVWDGLTATTLDPATGDVIDQVTLRDVSRLVMDGFEDGVLYAVSESGAVSKFVTR